jgi:hypothetical protein
MAGGTCTERREMSPTTSRQSRVRSGQVNIGYVTESSNV